MTSTDRSPNSANAAEFRKAVEELVASVDRLLEKTGGSDVASVKGRLDRVRGLLGAPGVDSTPHAGPEQGSQNAVPAARPVGSDEDIQKDLQRAML